MGKPTSLNATRQKTILAVIRKGGWRLHAARAAGIGEKTLYDWLDRGRRALELRDKGEAVTDREKPFLEFFVAFEKAESAVELAAMQRIMKKPVLDAGAAWWLERRFPKRWGRGQRLEIEGNVGSDTAVIVLPANGREAPE